MSQPITSLKQARANRVAEEPTVSSAPRGLVITPDEKLALAKAKKPLRVLDARFVDTNEKGDEITTPFWAVRVIPPGQTDVREFRWNKLGGKGSSKEQADIMGLIVDMLEAGAPHVDDVYVQYHGVTEYGGQHIFRLGEDPYVKQV